jgi:GNAT superfamily N-acetyltransferase
MMGSSPPIRPTGPGESGTLRRIEVAAGQCFTAVGLARVAAHPPHSVAAHAEYRRLQRSWVATDRRDRPVAFVVAAVVDGNAHIDEVAVDPAHAGQGIGRVLINHVGAWAEGSGRPAVTLTTYVEVPWNAPYYARCGFRPLDESEWGPELARIRRDEQDRGLDIVPRTAMVRPV